MLQGRRDAYPVDSPESLFYSAGYLLTQNGTEEDGGKILSECFICHGPVGSVGAGGVLFRCGRDSARG